MSGRVIVVTGTDTDVGKTVSTAYAAHRLLRRGARVHVDKPVQTGVRGAEPGDVDDILQRVGYAPGLTVSEGVRLHAPLAPRDAAELQGAQLPRWSAHLDRWRRLREEVDVLLIEGAGGITVELTDSGHTVVDIAAALGAEDAAPAQRVRLDVVVRADLGTQNHTRLTLEHALRRAAPLGDLVVGRAPAAPEPVHQINRRHLQAQARGAGMGWAEPVPAGWSAGGGRPRFDGHGRR